MKDVLKNIRVFVASNPTQSVQLISAARDVGKESRKLIGTNVQGDAYVAQLLLQHSRDQSRIFIRRGLQGEMESHTIHRGISGLLKQLPAPLRIVVVARHVAVVRPTFRR